MINRGEPRAARICGVPPALGSLCPASGWFVYGDMSSFFEPSGSLLNCHEWFPIAFPFTPAANALGLGAVWTAIYPFQDRIPKVQEMLNLPEQVIPLNIIPIGYPEERKLRENLYDPSRVHTNHW